MKDFFDRQRLNIVSTTKGNLSSFDGEVCICKECNFFLFVEQISIVQFLTSFGSEGIFNIQRVVNNSSVKYGSNKDLLPPSSLPKICSYPV